MGSYLRTIALNYVHTVQFSWVLLLFQRTDGFLQLRTKALNDIQFSWVLLLFQRIDGFQQLRTIALKYTQLGPIPISELGMGSYSYCATGRQLASWYGGSTQLEYDTNQEPTAADHGDVLYTIGTSSMVIVCTSSIPLVSPLWLLFVRPFYH